MAGYSHTYPEMAAAGLWTTPTDLLTLGSKVIASREGAEGSLLDKETTAKMLTVQSGPSGLGFFLTEQKDGATFGHDGADAGFLSGWFMYADGRGGAAVMVNADNGNPLIQEILTSIASVYGWSYDAPVELRATKYPNGEAIVRRMVEELVSGTPDYSRMSGPVAEVMRAQLPDLHKMFTELGAIQSVSFIKIDSGPDPRGADVYDVTLAKGAITYSIVLRPDGKVQTAGFTRKYPHRDGPQAGAEAALRRGIDELVRGEPNYDRLRPGLAQVVRQQLPVLQSILKPLGELKSVNFVEVTPHGLDIYYMTFANGSLGSAILLDADGNTERWSIMRAPAPAATP
jgi:hypothetical protein